MLKFPLLKKRAFPIFSSYLKETLVSDFYWRHTPRYPSVPYQTLTRRTTVQPRAQNPQSLKSPKQFYAYAIIKIIVHKLNAKSNFCVRTKVLFNLLISFEDVSILNPNF